MKRWLWLRDNRRGSAAEANAELVLPSEQSIDSGCTGGMLVWPSSLQQEAFEKCWAHLPLWAATLPFTRCHYCRTPPLLHAACASMSTTTTTTTRNRGDCYGPIEWAQWCCLSLRPSTVSSSELHHWLQSLVPCQYRLHECAIALDSDGSGPEKR